jgi:hypothetical protein
MFSILAALSEQNPGLFAFVSASLTVLVLVGAIGFVLLMVYNIKSFLTYRRRKEEGGDEDVPNAHSTFYWIVDGFFTVVFSLDFLSVFLFLI